MFGTMLAWLDTMSPVGKLLFVMGGFVLGGLLTGFLVNTLVRLTTKQKLPRVPLMVVRVLGGVIIGWVIILGVWGGGGSGMGWPGGWGLGTGSGSGTSTDKDKAKEGDTDSAAKEKGKEKDKSVSPSSDVPALRIEVLGPRPLQEITGNKDVNSNRCYRVNTPDGSKLLTLSEVKNLIQPEEGEPAWKRIEIVLYKDSPNKDNKRVEELENWAKRLLLKDSKEKVRVDLAKLGEDAPLK